MNSFTPKTAQSFRCFHFRLWCWNRLRVIFGNTFPAKRDVALRANKRGILLLLIDLEIQSPTIIGCGSDVTSVRSTARTHGDLQSFSVQRVHRRHAVTIHAVQVRMLSSFMPETAGGNPAAPFAEDRRVGYPHGGCQPGIEIGFRRLWQRLCRCQLMANVAVGWRGRNSGIDAVADETHRMTVRRG